MNGYRHFLKKIKGSFEDFLQSKEVNLYLQTIGREIKAEVQQDGLLSEFLIISGYEDTRGNWATAHNNQIRFGDTSIPVHDSIGSMVLTPNIFYGNNLKGEEIEYRMGLIKDDNNIRVLPVILRKIGTEIHSKVLDGLCVVHRGVAIDPESAKLLEQGEVSKITTLQQFLACFWNIDDYIRKLNPLFYSDFDIEVWTAVEVFSGRIVDQMLQRIANGCRDDPGWLIPEATIVYEQGLIRSIEKCLEQGNAISENQIGFLVKNLCSYMNRFENYQPLEKLEKKGINILPFMIQNFESPNQEVANEALRMYEIAIETKPELIAAIFPIIFEWFTAESPTSNFQIRRSQIREFQARNLFLKSFNAAFEKTAYLIDQQIVDQIVTRFTDPNRTVRYTALEACKSILQFTPQFINKSLIRQISARFEDPDDAVRLGALETYELVIEKAPNLVEKDRLLEIRLKIFLDRSKMVKKAAFKVYKSAFENTRQLIDQFEFHKTLSDSIHTIATSNLEILDTYQSIILNSPQFLGETQIKEIMTLFGHADKYVKRRALDLFRIIIEKTQKFINEKSVGRIIERVSDVNRCIRLKALQLYKLFLAQKPDLINQRGINAIMDRFSDVDKNVRQVAIDLYELILKISPHMIDQTRVCKGLEVVSDLNQETETKR